MRDDEAITRGQAQGMLDLYNDIYPTYKGIYVQCAETILYLYRVIDRCYEEFDFGKFGIDPWEDPDE